MKLKLEIVGKEVIKAASSLPHDLLQLSLVDLTSPGAYVSVIFFYKDEDLTRNSPEIVSQKLKNSLSETLSRFYPLAGRIEGVSIKCNNEGAVYTKAYTDLLLSDYFKNFDIYSLKELFPKIASDESPSSWPLISVQASFFGSGTGVAIAVYVSHMVCDAASISMFIQDWSTTSKGESNDELTTPQFSGLNIFPPPDANFKVPSFNIDLRHKRKCVMNRFVFESSKIVELKRKAASESVLVPTRVEAISALIWKCATKASSSNLVSPRSSCMMQPMDLRLRIPSNVLAQDIIGNLVTGLFLKKNLECEFKIDEIVAEIRKTKEAINEMIKENLKDYDVKNLGMKLMARSAVLMSEFNPKMDLYGITSWCRNPFYETDFGWGHPVWVGSGFHTLFDDQVYVMLIDVKDSKGVEAWISLPEQDMLAFVCDQEMLSYASLNPPILT